MTSNDRIIRDLLKKMVARELGDDLSLEVGQLTAEQRAELAQLLIDREVSRHNSN